MMFFEDVVAGVVPLWNQLAYYMLQMTNANFWVQDDPHDREDCVLPDAPPGRCVKSSAHK